MSTCSLSWLRFYALVILLNFYAIFGIILSTKYNLLTFLLSLLGKRVKITKFKYNTFLFIFSASHVVTTLCTIFQHFDLRKASAITTCKLTFYRVTTCQLIIKERYYKLEFLISRGKLTLPLNHTIKHPYNFNIFSIRTCRCVVTNLHKTMHILGHRIELN